MGSILLVLLGGVLPSAQEDAYRLVDQLHARSIDEREEAARRLKRMGSAAFPALDRAAQEKDAEVSGQARKILRAISIATLLGPALETSRPGVEHQLASGTPHTWTEKFLEAPSDLKREDLEFLAAMAVLGAEPGEVVQVQALAERRLLTASAPTIRKALRDGDLTEAALLSLARLDRKDAEILKALESPLGDLRLAAALLLETLGGRAAGPHFLRLCADRDGRVRQTAGRALAAVPGKETVTSLRTLLKDESVSVRTAALQSLAELGAKEAAADILPLLADRAGGVRRAAAGALGALGAKEAVEGLVGALRDESPAVRAAAVLALGDLDARKAVPEIRKLLEDKNGAVRAAVTDVLDRLKE
jgi:HEAT repeat protein